MSVDGRSVLGWLALWTIVLAGLTVQACLDIRMIGAELDREAEAQARAEAEMLRLEVELGCARAGSEPDEFLVRPVVLDVMERRPQLAAAAVWADGRLLEAQERLGDGTLAPMEEEPGQAAREDRLEKSLEFATEEGACQVWIALDMRPSLKAAEERSRAACLHLAACAAGTGALLALVVFFIRSRRQVLA
ncbi:MAG: hypothetical protein Q4F72_07740 [Desulfovibrionaceae bacterium]|nr:hypothetical protein [Desulfovibrionaceae bacterium]